MFLAFILLATAGDTGTSGVLLRCHPSGGQSPTMSLNRKRARQCCLSGALWARA